MSTRSTLALALIFALAIGPNPNPNPTQVYRGVSGFGLPTILTTKNAHNVIGGVEFAFLSTTLDRDVAMRWAASPNPSPYP